MATKSVRKSNSETTPKSSKIKNVRSPILTRSSNIKELNSDKIQKSNAKISKELAKENLQKKVEEEEEDNGDIELPSDDESDDEDIKGLEESEDEQTSNEIKKNSTIIHQQHQKIRNLKEVLFISVEFQKVLKKKKWKNISNNLVKLQD
ncbi:unnamed protein product [[Candida] boidinii]|nr:unnamed protein product [[Candida] boidinii]